MRILHTSDWHLGRQFHGLSLEADHAVVLNQVYSALVTHKPQVLIIAGDIYDRASPPASAVRQFNEFIKQVAADTDAAIVLIAGNHDSGDRIESMSVMTDPTRALIRGPLIVEERPLILTDDDGPVAFSALPFGYEFDARACFDTDEIDCHADVIKAQLAVAKALVPNNARWVVVAHAFVTGANPSDSERNLGRAVGGIETVSSDAFEGAQYVALGHLHRPQSIGEDRIRYSGSPLAFGFDESDAQKSMSLIDLAGDGSIITRELPFTPMRQVKTLRGKLSDLIASGVSSDDFVKIVLTDEVMLIDPMKRVRELYPNACALSYERDETPYETKTANVVQAALTEPSAVVEEFLRHVRGEPQSEAEAIIIEAQLKSLQEAEG